MSQVADPSGGVDLVAVAALVVSTIALIVSGLVGWRQIVQGRQQVDLGSRTTKIEEARRAEEIAQRERDEIATLSAQIVLTHKTDLAGGDRNGWNATNTGRAPAKEIRFQLTHCEGTDSDLAALMPPDGSFYLAGLQPGQRKFIKVGAVADGELFPVAYTVTWQDARGSDPQSASDTVFDR